MASRLSASSALASCLDPFVGSGRSLIRAYAAASTLAPCWGCCAKNPDKDKDGKKTERGRDAVHACELLIYSDRSLCRSIVTRHLSQNKANF